MHMIQLLEQAIEKIRRLPEDQQVYAAEMLNSIADHTTDGPLTTDEIEGVKRAQAQVERGEFADEQVATFYKRIGS